MTNRQTHTVRVAKQRRSPLRIVGTVVWLAVAVPVVAAAVLVVLLPRLLDGTSLTVLTGSMRPTLAPGDVVVVRNISPSLVCPQVEVGQVVTFLPEPDNPTLITHRVVAKTSGTYDDGTSCRLITQGDANYVVDDEPISPVQVRGVMVFSVPKLGLATRWLGNHIQVVAIGCLLLVVYMLWDGVRPPRTRVVGCESGTPGSQLLASQVAQGPVEPRCPAAAGTCPHLPTQVSPADAPVPANHP